MASEVEICNMALARLGDEATVTSINPPEGSPQSAHCAMWYPIARNNLLESHPWSFATERVQLAELSATNSWFDHTYAMPANSLRVLAVTPAAEERDPLYPDGRPFEVARSEDDVSVISTDVASAWARCVMVTYNSAKFPPMFVDSLSWLLASYLAGPILKGNTGLEVSQKLYSTYTAVVARARTVDANEQYDPRPYVPSGIAVRN